MAVKTSGGDGFRQRSVAIFGRSWWLTAAGIDLVLYPEARAIDWSWVFV